MTKDLKRLKTENQQIPKLRMGIEDLQQDLIRVRLEVFLVLFDRWE